MSQEPRKWPAEWLEPTAPSEEMGASVINMYPQCVYCQHFQGVDEATGVARCGAFTEGIPWRIWMGLDPHLEPIEGDSGLQYSAPDLGIENVPDEVVPAPESAIEEEDMPESSWTAEELAEITGG